MDGVRDKAFKPYLSRVRGKGRLEWLEGLGGIAR